MSVKNQLILLVLGLSNIAFSQIDSLININPQTPKVDSNFVIERNITEDIQPLSFMEFENVLGVENAEILSAVGAIPMFGVSVIRNKKYFSLRLGYSYQSKELNHTTDAYTSSFQTEFDLGYSVINVKRWRITPQASIKWMRFTLQNHNNDKKIPLGQFVANQRTLDIRFNQLLGNLGVRLDYKIFGKLAKGYDFMTVGLYTGYAFGLHVKPSIRSQYSKLTHENTIDVFPWNFRLVFGFDIFRK